MPLPDDVTTAELLRWMFDRLNDHDVASLRRFWTPETVEYFPRCDLPGSRRGREVLRGQVRRHRGFHLEVVAIVVEGDDAMVHWRMTGRHVGPVLGVAGTGRPIRLDGIDHFVLREATVVSNTVVFDQIAFARQVGLLPADRSATDRALKALFNARTRLVGAVRRRMDR